MYNQQQQNIDNVEKDEGSEIYVLDYYKHNKHPYNASEDDMRSYVSGYPPGSVLSEQSSVKTSRKGGVVVETMSAPNPCCPNTKGVCCLLLLINLGLILLTLGFSIVLQILEPPFVWYCGILFVVVGFVALLSSMIFCVGICRGDVGDGRWTHHWSKRLSL